MSMSLIDNEKNKLFEWAELSNYAFHTTDDNGSFFSDIDADDKIYEMKFDTIPELKKMLTEKKKQVNDSSVDLVCAVATFKYKNQFLQEKKVEENTEDVIPDFIYNF